MSSIFMTNINHKLETGQDIFRAKTVRALVTEIDSLISQRNGYQKTAVEQRDELACLRTLNGELVAALKNCDGFLLESRNHEIYGEAARELRLQIEVLLASQAATPITGQAEEGN